MNNEDMVLWYDYESGEPVWITRESYDAIMEMRAAFMAGISKKLAESGVKIKPIVMSSISDPNDNIKNLWEEYSKAKQDLSIALGITESRQGSGLVRYFTPNYQPDADKYGKQEPDKNPYL